MNCQCGADGFGPCAPSCTGPATVPPAATPLVPDVTMIVPDDIELHSWPPERRGGQHTNKMSCGILAVHKPTGIAIACDSERSMMKNREKAIARLSIVVDEIKYGPDGFDVLLVTT